MDSRVEALNRVRQYLAQEGYSAIIIPSNDPHFGEYVPAYYDCRSYLSGFNGSAGTLVVTDKKAALWTDSRYFVQAENQLKGSEIVLMKMKVEGTPSISFWLKENLEEDEIVALDEDLFSYQEYAAMVDELSPITPTLVEDPFDEIWPDRPQLEFGLIENMPESICGESIVSKHKRLCEKLDFSLPFEYIITSLDDIAWLCNIRGTDVDYNPLVLSYAVVTNEHIVLFICQEKLTPEAMNSLTTQGVIIRKYEAFSSYLRIISKDHIRVFAGNKITAKNYFASLENVYQDSFFPTIMPDPVFGGVLSLMKAVKNDVEVEGFNKAYIEDSIAWKKLLEFIHTQIVEKESAEYELAPLNEYDIVKQLISFRKESPYYCGESFEPIVAYGSNAALPHYSPSADHSSKIEKRGFLLIDTGGQYTFGTTDTTRTIPLGPLTPEEREDYTRVLKGMIDLSMASFPKGTRGASLDILARGPVFAGGKMYMHGTGHGIGHHLCVHEGPQSIRMEENPTSLLPGMVLSNEPAVYVEGKYGIRHENTILVKRWISNEFNDFYRFDTLTRVPIETSPIVESILCEDEKRWLEDFNKR